MDDLELGGGMGGMAVGWLSGRGVGLVVSRSLVLGFHHDKDPGLTSKLSFFRKTDGHGCRRVGSRGEQTSLLWEPGSAALFSQVASLRASYVHRLDHPHLREQISWFSAFAHPELVQGFWELLPPGLVPGDADNSMLNG